MLINDLFLRLLAHNITYNEKLQLDDISAFSIHEFALNCTVSDTMAPANDGSQTKNINIKFIPFEHANLCGDNNHFQAHKRK